MRSYHLGLFLYTILSDSRAYQVTGSLFDAKILDITDDILPEKLVAALNAISNLSLVLQLLTEASVTHSVANTFKACVAVTVEMERCIFETAEVCKAYLADPSAFAGSGGSGAAAAAKVVAEEEEVEETPLAVDIFGGGDNRGDY